MKLVKENINEKFRENSDPVDDLNIGRYKDKVQKLKEKLGDLWDENYELMLDNKDRSQAIETIEEIQHLVEIIFG